MNGATEATLAELLAVAESMNVNISRLVSGLGSGGSGGGLAGAAAAATPVGKAFSLLSGAASAVGSVFSTLGSIIGKTIGGLVDTGKALYDFSLKAVEGSARLSDFYRALERLPFFIGTIAGLVADFVRYTERLLDTYRDLSRTGASFSGNLFAMALQASKSYLTLSEFAKIVSKNSDIFASMGGNVQAGLNQFVNVQNRLMGPNSTYARQLLGLGYTFEEAGELVASYMRGQGNIAKLEKENINSITAGIMKYAIELDTLTKMTGKRREQLEAEVREIEQEQEWQAYLAALPKDAAELAKTALTQAIGVGGKEFGPSVRLAIQQGLVIPLDENQSMLSIITQGQREVFLNSISQMFRAGVSIETMGKTIRQNGLIVGNSLDNFRKSVGPLAQIGSATGKSLLSAGQGFDSYRRTVNNVQTAEQKAAAEREKQYKNNAAALAQAELTIRQFGTSLFAIVSDYLAPMVGPLSAFAEGILRTVRDVLANPEFKKSVQNVIDWFRQAFTYLRSSGDMSTFFSRTFEIMSSVFAVIQPRLMYYLENIFQNLYDFAMDFIKGGPRSRIRKAEEDLAAATERRVINEKTASDLLAQYGSVNKMNREQLQQYQAAQSEVFQAKSAEERQVKNIQALNTVIQELDRKRDEKQATRLAEVDAKTQAALAALKYQSQYGWNNAGRGNSPGRAFGTLGVTGKFWESGPKAVTIGESGPESVINPEIMREVVAASSSLGSKNLVDQLNQLNNTQVRLVTLLSRIEDNTKRSFNAINNLNRDQFSMA